MKAKYLGTVAAVLTLLLGFTGMAQAKEAPVAKLVQVEGEVEYTRNGVTWRPVRQTKYLFPGYKIKTGSNGGGKVINQATGESQNLGSDSEIAVISGGVELLNGNLSQPKAESTSIWDALMNKFAKAQRYTTVRRSVTDPNADACDPKVRTVRDLSVSPSHPEIVWRNACPEYSYKLVLNGEEFSIPAQATAEMISFPASELKPGSYDYRVEVLDKDGTVYIPRRDSKVTMLSKKEERELMKMVGKAGDDSFLKADMLERSGMYVVAMEEYRAYFADNPDDNDMRPLLIQSYNNLKLTNLREKEARLYNAELEEDFLPEA